MTEFKRLSQKCFTCSTQRLKGGWIPAFAGMTSLEKNDVNGVPGTVISVDERKLINIRDESLLIFPQLHKGKFFAPFNSYA